MTVRRKGKPAPKHDAVADVDAIINKGGRTTAEAKEDRSVSETRFTLRMPGIIMDKVDKSRKARVGNISRNQWILEAISKSLHGAK